MYVVKAANVIQYAIDLSGIRMTIEVRTTVVLQVSPPHPSGVSVGERL